MNKIATTEEKIEQNERIMERNRKMIEELAEAFSRTYGFEIGVIDIGEALFMLWENKRELFWELDLLDIEYTYQEAYDALKQIDFVLYKHEIETPYELIEDIPLMQRKALVKAKGAIWKINLYDPDPFPSLPHAHQLEENIKLDLTNGNCFRRREYLKTLPKRELILIREKIEKVFKGKLPELAI